MISLIIALLINQVGVCKPGSACEVGTFRTTGRPLSPCTVKADGGNSSNIGLMMFDYTTNMYYSCNGAGWAPMASDAGTVTFTATAPIVVSANNITCTAASASAGGCLTRSGANLVVDGGIILMNGAALRAGASGINTDGGVLLVSNAKLSVGPAGISTDGGIIVTSYDSAGNAVTILNGSFFTMDNSGIYVNSAGTKHFYYDGTYPAVNGDFKSYGTVISAAGSGSDAFSIVTNGARVHFGAGASDYASSDGTTVTFAGALKASSTTNKGVVTLGVGGTGTVTVTAGVACTCTYSTVGIIILLCNVSSTTLTITGSAGADVAYNCF